MKSFVYFHNSFFQKKQHKVILKRTLCADHNIHLIAHYNSTDEPHHPDIYSSSDNKNGSCSYLTSRKSVLLFDVLPCQEYFLLCLISIFDIILPCFVLLSIKIAIRMSCGLLLFWDINYRQSFFLSILDCICSSAILLCQQNTELILFYRFDGFP